MAWAQWHYKPVRDSLTEGEELVSTLHRKSITRKEIALASSRDTSESEDSGQPDKLPVPAHRGRTTCEQEALQSTKNVLPEHGILAQNPFVQLEKNPVGEPSLSGEPECLSLHSDILSVIVKSGHQDEEPMKRAGGQGIGRRKQLFVRQDNPMQTKIEQSSIPESDARFILDLDVPADRTEQVHVSFDVSQGDTFEMSISPDLLQRLLFPAPVRPLKITHLAVEDGNLVCTIKRDRSGMKRYHPILWYVWNILHRSTPDHYSMDDVVLSREMNLVDPRVAHLNLDDISEPLRSEMEEAL